MRIGIDLGGTKIEAIALSASGQLLASQRLDTPQGDYEQTLRGIQELVLQMEQVLEQTGTVGICTPGSASPTSGLMRNANSVCLNGRALQRDMEALLQRPLRLANDADCFALSEATDGAAAQARSVFGVIIGTGTGGGIVIDKKVLSGPNAIAGEWGHNPLPWPSADERPGRDCYCGKKGCIETWLSGPGLLADYQQSGGAETDIPAILAAANSGDPIAESALRQYESRAARSLASIINVLDPEMIVLGGGLSNIDRLYRNIPNIWEQYIFSDTATTQLVPPRHGDSSGIRGAAWLWPV